MSLFTKISSHPVLRSALTGLCVAILVFAGYVAQPSMLKVIDFKVYDFFLKSVSGGQPPSGIIIVDIDEKSLKRYGQWPWPRYLMAKLVEELHKSGVAAIGLDILFSEQDRTSLRHIKEYLHEDLGVNVGFLHVPSQLEDNDTFFATALRSAPVVLGTKLLFQANATLPEVMPNAPAILEIAKTGAPAPRQTLLRATGMITPLPELTKEALLGGFDVTPQQDGIVRYVPLLTAAGDEVYPGFALRTLMRGLGVNALTLKGDENGLAQVEVKGLPAPIPVTPDGSFYVAYRGPRQTYEYISAADVLEARVNKEIIDGSIVLVGTSATGLVDVRATPFDAVYPGVEVHAAVIDSIITSRFIAVPPWSPAAQAAIILFMGIATGMLFGLARPVVYLAGGALLLGWCYYGTLFLARSGMYVSPLYGWIVIVTEGFFLVLYRFWLADKQKRFIQSAFGRYVAPQVVSHIIASKRNYLEGEKRDVTILFTDIRKFTALSEKMEPEKVVQFLNSYFTPITAVIRENGGTLDKFIGDSVMAFWNAPITVQDHSAKAVATVFAIQKRLKEMNLFFEASMGVTVDTGIALHAGEVFVGNMGSSDLMDYTIIGDNVNLASRIEGLCSQYGLSFLVSEVIMKRCPYTAFYLPVDTLRVKGKQQPVAIYAPFTHSTAVERKEEFELFIKGREFLLEGNGKEAKRCFQQLVVEFPLSNLYAIYLNRCSEI